MQQVPRATAQVNIAASVPWVVPFVITKEHLDRPGFFDQQWTQRMYNKNNPHKDFEFDYMNVHVKGPSHTDYIKYLKYGYQDTFNIGEDMTYYAPSSGSKESVDALADRIDRDPNTDPEQAKIGDPRVMLVPLVEEMLPRSGSGGEKMKIIGFTGYFLEEVHKGSYGTTYYAKGRFLEGLNVGAGHDTTTDPNADWGVCTYKLIE